MSRDDYSSKAPYTQPYSVIRALEYNGFLFLPAGSTPPDHPTSAGNGKATTVNTTGTIYINTKDAETLTKLPLPPIQ